MFDRILKTPLIFWFSFIRTKNLFQLSLSANVTDQKYQDLNSVLVKGKKPMMVTIILKTVSYTLKWKAEA